MMTSKRIRKVQKDRLRTKSRSLTQRPLWIIISYRNNQMDVLTLDPDSDGGYLAVFSFNEEAEAFLSLLEDDRKRGWQSRQMSAGELVSILLGPCAGVRAVTLDPLLLLFSRVMLRFASVNKERFVRDLLEEAKGAREESVPACLRSPRRYKCE